MRQVREGLALPTPAGPQGVSLWANNATQVLAALAQEFGYRLNRVAPLDGSEGFTSLKVEDSAGTDFGIFSHDGIDFNTAFTNTTDWNITGLTSIQISATIDGDVSLLVDNDSTGTSAFARYNLSSGDANVALYAVGSAFTGTIVTGGPTGAQSVLRTLGNYPLVFATNNTERARIDGNSGNLLCAANIIAQGADTPPSALQSSLSANMLHLDGKEAIDGNDTFLRLNQNGDFTNGVFTPGNIRTAGQLIGVNGTASAPAILSVSDTDTGIFFSTAGVNASISGTRVAAVFANGISIDPGSLYLSEKAAAHSDIAGHGQIWVKNTTPTQLWFTDDAGNDTQIV